MKIQIVSDLHLEFLCRSQIVEIADRISWRNTADVLILSGDICSLAPKTFQKFITFVDEIKDKYSNIIYVFDNHEYYGTSKQEMPRQYLRLLNNYYNLHILDNDFITLEDVTFYGTTLWFEETVEASMKRHYLNDYRCIQDFTPDDWCREAIKFIKEIASSSSSSPDDETKKVLITHHVPHSRFISEKYVGNEMNCFYLTEIGKVLDKFDLVTFGHSHESVDQQFSDRCHAISNPRGYLKAPDTCISYSDSSSSTEGSNDKFQYQLLVEV